MLLEGDDIVLGGVDNLLGLGPAKGVAKLVILALDIQKPLHLCVEMAGLDDPVSFKAEDLLPDSLPATVIAGALESLHEGVQLLDIFFRPLSGGLQGCVLDLRQLFFEVSALLGKILPLTFFTRLQEGGLCFFGVAWHGRGLRFRVSLGVLRQGAHTPDFRVDRGGDVHLAGLHVVALEIRQFADVLFAQGDDAAIVEDALLLGELTVFALEKS